MRERKQTERTERTGAMFQCSKWDSFQWDFLRVCDAVLYGLFIAQYAICITHTHTHVSLALYLFPIQWMYRSARQIPWLSVRTEAVNDNSYPLLAFLFFWYDTLRVSLWMYVCISDDCIENIRTKDVYSLMLLLFVVYLKIVYYMCRWFSSYCCWWSCVIEWTDG